jgi:hypothetical protein
MDSLLPMIAASWLDAAGFQINKHSRAVDTALFQLMVSPLLYFVRFNIGAGATTHWPTPKRMTWSLIYELVLTRLFFSI